MSKSSQKRERERKRRERGRGRRLHDLYDRLDRARGLPPEEAVRICKTIVNDSILDNDEDLEATTGVRAETFDVYLDALKAVLDGDPQSPLYHGRPGRDADPGRRSPLHPAHRMLMYLESKKQDGSQKAMAARYGVSQPTVSKCIEYTENALGGFGATADNIRARMNAARTTDKLQSALREALTCVLRLAGASTEAPASVPKTLPHNRLIRDGFHTPHDRPSNKGLVVELIPLLIYSRAPAASAAAQSRGRLHGRPCARQGARKDAPRSAGAGTPGEATKGPHRAAIARRGIRSPDLLGT